MTSEGLGEMIEGDSADMCHGVNGGPSGDLPSKDPEARTPIGGKGNLNLVI
jgi:hypothetical protein